MLVKGGWLEGAGRSIGEAIQEEVFARPGRAARGA
jgi:hypothetical protein